MQLDILRSFHTFCYCFAFGCIDFHNSKLTPKYNIHLNGKYFDAIYPVDYYNDKKIFHDSGARQFFVIYQLACSRKHELTIEETGINVKIVMNNELQFKEWVAENYPMYLNYLENYN